MKRKITYFVMHNKSKILITLESMVKIKNIMTNYNICKWTIFEIQKKNFQFTRIQKMFQGVPNVDTLSENRPHRHI